MQLHIIHTNHPAGDSKYSSDACSRRHAVPVCSLGIGSGQCIMGRSRALSLDHPAELGHDRYVLGVISGTPHAINVGDTVVTVQASDGKGGIATQSYPLHVIIRIMHR